MSAPLYVTHWRGRNQTAEILERDHEGDYCLWLSLDLSDARKAREVVRGLNELEAARARKRRDARRRQKAARARSGPNYRVDG